MNEKKYQTNSAACRELVSRAVRVVKQWNYDHPEQKWCITNKLISELTGITTFGDRQSGRKAWFNSLKRLEA